jgi:hypothetical protein
MRKAAAVLLVLLGTAVIAASSRAQSPSPIGLYGHWSSARFPGGGGDIKLTDIVVNANGEFVGRVFFTGTPCAVWANFTGRLYGDTAVLSMVVGNCGLDEVALQRQGPGWVGTYRSQYPDEGTVQMLP